MINKKKKKVLEDYKEKKVDKIMMIFINVINFEKLDLQMVLKEVIDVRNVMKN